MAAGWGALTLVGALYRARRGRTGIGRGDAKLFGAIGAWLGWAMLPAVLLGACLIALAVLGVRHLMGRRVSATDELAFGAALAAAAWPAWLALAVTG
jgi:leader peptidase (prepilin peptidase)/N-methyltransferase